MIEKKKIYSQKNEISVFPTPTYKILSYSLIKYAIYYIEEIISFLFAFKLL